MIQERMPISDSDIEFTMRLPFASIALLVITTYCHAQGGSPERTAAMDKALTDHFTGDAPGGAVLVAKGGVVLYEKAIGLADITKKTPLSTDNVFRIGSVSKQFTALAILQLADAGKLKLSDEIQLYVAFPKKGQIITIEHLLTHTSGIPNYTAQPSFNAERYGKDITLDSLIASFAELPLEFAPGTKWNYSNSGYILLGAILEKASGQSWEAYLREHIFKPAGMSHSSASAFNGQLPGEALGYAEGDSGYEVATYLSMSWPYAAGTMRSTVGDLWAWNRSVFAGKLLPRSWVEKAHTEHLLTDGSATHYGYGWSMMNVQGSRTIEHGGGINGFVSRSLYLPEEDIYVAVLTNRESDDASTLAPTLAAIAMGKPYAGTVVPLDPKKAAEYTGVYTNKDSVERYITADEKGLHSQRQGSSVRDLDHLGNDRFLAHGDVITFTFQRTDGKVTGALLRTRQSEEQLTRTDKPLPTRTELPLNGEELQKYVGEYELMPGFTLTFRVEGDRFFAQATGQPEFELYGEGPDAFFLKVVDARIVFYPEADGTVKRMKLFQGGEMEGKRIE